MSNNFKPAYRKKKIVMSTSVKVIIILLAVLVVTLLAFLIKVMFSKALDPNIVYPPDDTEEFSAAPHTDAPAVTDEEDPGIKIRAVDKSKFDTKTGSLVLVNKDTAYTLPKTEQLVNLYDALHENFTLATISESLTRDAYDALCKMCNAYAERTGYCPLMVTSGYRDEEQQKEFYDNYVVNESDKAYVELPRYSDHHTGLAFDMKLYEKDGSSYSYGRYATERASWLVENHKYYGFIMRYPANKGAVTGIEGESNHFRYVGVPHSVFIEENNICLEEYLTFIKNYTYTEPLKITVNNDDYCVWYCGGNSVYIPKEEEYTVSGDNLGGYIVAVKL